MSTAPSLLISPWISAACGFIILVLAVMRRRPAKGSRSFGAMMVILAWLAISEGVAQTSSGLTVKVLWHKASYVSLVSMPLAWLAFVLRYTELRSLTRRELALLAIEPAIALVMVWTNEAHGGIWRDVRLDPSVSPPRLLLKYGGWFWVHAGYSCLVGGYATFLFLQARKQLPRLQGRQVGQMLLAALAPAAASVVYVLAPGIGATALVGTLLLSCALLAWAMLRLGLFELKPVALQAVMAQMQDGVIVVDAMGRIADFNPAAHRLLGPNARLTPGRGAIRSLSTLPGVAAHLTGEAHLQEELRTSRDGRQQHLEMRSSPLRDDLGRSLGRLLVLRDVTAVSTAASALAESEEKYRLLVERANDGIAIIQEGLVVYGNPRLFETLGYAPNEMLGQPINEFIWHKDRASVLERYKRRMAGEDVPPIYETGVRHRDGSRLAVELNAGLVPFQRKTADLVLVRDISERVRTRRKLAANSRRLVEELAEREQAEQTARQRAEELAALQKTVLEITAPNDLSVLLETIVQRAAQLLHAPAGGLYLCDQDERTVRCVVSFNTPGDYRGTVLQYGEGAAGVVAETGQPLMIDDYRLWVGRAKAYEGNQPFSAVLSAPMVWQGAVTGVIHVLEHAPERRFTEQDLQLLNSFASHAAIAVENARLREEAQRELAERARLQSFSEGIIASMTEGLLVEDGQGTITFANPAAVRTLGYLQEELVGQHWTLLVPEGEIDFIEQRMAERTAESTDQYETALLAKDGQTVPVLIGARPMFEAGQFAGVLSTFTDITERKRLEAETEQRRLYLERVLSSAPDAIVTLDRQDCVVDWNDGAERLFGYSAEQARGQGIDQLVAKPERDNYEEALSLTRKLHAGEEVQPMEAVRYRQDGSPVQVIVAAAPILVDGELAGVVGVYTDLSVVKRLEAESEERRLYLESVLASAPDAILTLDRQHRVVDWNLGAERIFGHAAAEAHGQDIDDLVSQGDPATRAEAVSLSEEVFAGAAHSPAEVIRFRKDGRAANLITAASPILVGGELRGAVVVYSDITELKTAEAELRQSEARYRAVVEDQTEMVTRFLPDGSLTFVNDSTVRFVGKSPEELLGSSIYDDMPAEDRQHIRQRLGRLSGSNPVASMRNRVVSSEGQVRWVQWTDRAIFDAEGQMVEVQSVGRDITEQRLAEKQLREAEAKYRSLVETSPDGITVTDLQGKVTLSNPQAATMHGYQRPEEMLGLDAFDCIAAEDHQRAAENMERTLHQGSIHDIAYTLVRKDGSRFPAELSASVIRDAAGAPQAFLAVTRDTTERKRAEARLEASLAEKNMLLKEVHHRVKNNLQVISSLLYLQATKAERPDTRELFRSSRNQIHSMALVHEKIYGSGDLARVDFHGYVRDLTTSLLQSYGAASAWIDLALNVEQLQLGIDLAIPCGLVINELVTNALRHAFDERQQGRIGIDFQRADGYYHLQVKDDGRGLPPAIDPQTTPSLGLQLVSTLVEQLEGSLDIQRAGGTRFNIRFPADAQPEPLAAPADHANDTVPA